MKSAILASSVAVLASGATMPKMNGVSEVRKLARDNVRTHKTALKKETTAEGKTALKKDMQLKAQAVVKDEGLVTTEGYYAPKFEFRRGHTDCMNTVGTVDGFEMNRCTDIIYRDSGDDVGYPESEMFVKPNNGGFPIMLFFDGHGCKDYNLMYTYRFPKVEMGFPGTYTAGNCMAMTNPDGSPSFHQIAEWTPNEYAFTGPYGQMIHSNREAGCWRGKHSGYHMVASGLCMDDESEDGTVEYWKIDVSTCSTGVIMETKYSDSACTTSVNTTAYHMDSCLFDYDEFFNELNEMYGASAYLEYTSMRCGTGAV